ncbi:uncharacterized protein HMPREF1541_10830 [Cyphellophora europaea CBS 101466]|uniref:Uncharacterized protein n=1 Tax=Cyphellophora europaea (strain CBS 101466) TaxID=1220924 RepID=W2S5T1_CYPE1|nr:uncharacterized protein HMPREF1541_10830 [Cyphellophora europaea CBS 101466]ETN43965.1 hypothetical protein HMPREF1541_10830 [Cyphellophora europaea CBS 101466]
MSDGHPPRKKSRFFAEGKGMFRSLMQRHSSKHSSGSDGEDTTPLQSSHPRPDQASGRERPPLLDFSSSVSSTPVGVFGQTLTLTATAFKELSVEEKEYRRKGIYGAQSLLVPANIKDGTTIANTYRQDHGFENPAANVGAVLPWQRGNIFQQSEQRQVSLVNVSLDAIQQSQFTFQAPLQPTNSSLPLAVNSFAQGRPSLGYSQTQATRMAGFQPPVHDYQASPLHTPSAARELTVQKQRLAVPPSPKIANFPPIPAPSVHDDVPNAHPLIATMGAVDLDRDVRGHRIQQHVSGFTNLPQHAATSSALNAARQASNQATTAFPDVPENALTSPNRLERANKYAGRKRKRGGVILPPPAYVFTRKNDPKFNIFHGILLYPELCFSLAAHLAIEDLISLYAISKDFHTIIDTRFTTVILSQAIRKAPSSSRIFPFRSFGHLCRTDPAARIAHPDPVKAAQGIVRRIPSFKWLRMILHRDKTVHAIMALFAEKGIPLPRRCELAIKKVWFMLDIPDNARRIGFVHNKKLLTDADLYFAVCFCVKLDMLFHDPVAPNKFSEGRRLILSQRSLTMLLRVLQGEALSTRWDMLQEYITWRYEPGTEEEVDENDTLFGVPRQKWGVMKKEYWGDKKPTFENGRTSKAPSLLLRPDQLVLREAIKRGLRFAGHYVKFMQYGYIHPKTLENFEPRGLTRRIEDYKEDEYTMDDAVAGVRALAVEEGGDPYLDLGRPGNASAKVMKREEISRAERDHREKEASFIAQMYAESLQERRALGLR